MLLLFLFFLEASADSSERPACSLLPSVKCPWGLVTMSQNQCTNGFKYISCGRSWKKGANQEWIIDEEARLSNVRRSKPEGNICWKRSREQLQVVCQNSEECERLTTKDARRICQVSDESSLPSGSKKACATSNTTATCNGVTASISKEECQKGFHYLYCGVTAVREGDDWRLTGQSKHFLYGGIPDSCRAVNETSFILICNEGKCEDAEWRRKSVAECAARTKPVTEKKTRQAPSPPPDNGPFKEDWFHSEEDLLQNMVEIEEKSVEKTHSPLQAVTTSAPKDNEEDGLSSRLSRNDRMADADVIALNEDLDRNDLTLQGIAQNLKTLTRLVQNISDTVHELESIKERNTSVVRRPFIFGPNPKALKNCSIIISSLLFIFFLILALRCCRKKIRSRTPLPDLTPIENGERTTSLQVVTETTRVSLLHVEPASRIGTLRGGGEGGEGGPSNRKSFFLEDNNMQEIIEKARDMQLREDHESQM